ncbi:MAG: Hsp70 family protein [Polyangiaceae bacterium]
MEVRRVVGIDLGTTHTVVAWAFPKTAPWSPDDPPLPVATFPIPQLVTAGEIGEVPLLPSCLYAPIAGEVPKDPFGDAPWALGTFAKRRGAEAPGRFVSSAKSWLCHPDVDRHAAILPWGTEDAQGAPPKLSPIEASSRILAHVRTTWNAAHPGAKLEDQEVILTVPASFDEVARELTVLAATRAGLHVRLLEEPQAAFYDFLRLGGPSALAKLTDRHPEGRTVLVCDVGGGTTDLSLVRIERALGAKGDAFPFTITRIAVGAHLLLGGDNMDLALAHMLEARLVAKPARLDATRFAQLVLASRAAKEALLGERERSPESFPIRVVGAGSSLVGNTLSADLARRDVEQAILGGFFPSVPEDVDAPKAKSALVAFGLPYQREVAITAHVARFLRRHSASGDAPSAVLLNGGVFRSPAIREALANVLASWCGRPIDVLAHVDPDLSVARGAVSYGLALRGFGVRIEGGAARGYYVATSSGTGTDGRQAVCLVPRGGHESELFRVHDRTFALTLGQPVRFDLFASDLHVHEPGAVVTLDAAGYEALAPMATVVGEATNGGPKELRVVVEAELTPVGTLDVACVEASPPVGDDPRRFRLAFSLSEGVKAGVLPSAARTSLAPLPGRSSFAPPSTATKVSGPKWDETFALVDAVFGKKGEAGSREVKDLVRELERVLGARPTWTLETCRALFDRVSEGRGFRRRSADHERVFWMIAGYGIRPGFGDVADGERVRSLLPLFEQRLAFPAEARGWQQFWIAWRRVAGGLDGTFQGQIRDLVDPFLASDSAGVKKPKKWKPEAEDMMLEMAAALERVPASRRLALGEWTLERTWTSKDARLWSAIGRVGARLPSYASVDHVVSARAATTWLERLLREKWSEVSSATLVARDLARKTGDRARDVDENVRLEVIRRMTEANAKPEWIVQVRDLVVADAEDAAAFLGESLPVGLRLV